MSKNEPANIPASEAEHGFVVDALTAAGCKFVQGDGKGRIWVELPTGIVLAITAVVPKAPLPDLSGKNKVTKAKDKAE